jgi:hypothetical protein
MVWNWFALLRSKDFHREVRKEKAAKVAEKIQNEPLLRLVQPRLVRLVESGMLSVS